MSIIQLKLLWWPQKPAVEPAVNSLHSAEHGAAGYPPVILQKKLSHILTLALFFLVFSKGGGNKLEDQACGGYTKYTISTKKRAREGESRGGRGGGWRKAAVIRAERYSRCRRMQVAPAALDEVLLPCWATKLFIRIKQGRPMGRKRKLLCLLLHDRWVDAVPQSRGFYQRDKIYLLFVTLSTSFFPRLLEATDLLILFPTQQLFLSFACWRPALDLQIPAEIKGQLHRLSLAHHRQNTVTSSIIDRQDRVVQATVHTFC